MHGRQAAQVVRARDTGMGQAAALALLIKAPSATPDVDDQRVDTAVVKADTAIVAFVFGPTRPTPDLAVP
jgi:hypothetical protein